MPELPDVEVLKRYIDATALHQPIAGVHVRDPIVLEELEPQDLARRCQGRSFQATGRHGKYLFVDLSDSGWLVLHFGMTGDLRYYKAPPRQAAQQAPEHTQVRFDFENGYHLAHVMMRKLGQVRLIEDPDAFIAAKELGPDAMDPGFDVGAFQKAMAGRRGMIKSALMDQSLIAGIGNVYSDEILFQVRVHPRTQVKVLDEEALRDIYQAMRQVLATAIDKQAQPDQFPPGYLTPHRQPGASCPRCQGQVQRVKVSGRSAYFCPSCQPSPGTPDAQEDASGPVRDPGHD